LDDLTSWEGFFGCWPAMIVAGLSLALPNDYAAAPRIRVGSSTADPPSSDKYEVRLYERKNCRRLVSAIEIVSPANKDQPIHRRAFVARCAALLQERISVTIIDLVTTHHFNLYAELQEVIAPPAPSVGMEPAPLYAVSCRTRKQGNKQLLETWAHPLLLSQPLPTIPLWLDDNVSMPLELETSYQETCRILRLP
jgi:hypothetical protein